MSAKVPSPYNFEELKVTDDYTKNDKIVISSQNGVRRFDR